MEKQKILPKDDLVFQAIFGKVGNEEITRRLLSLIMGKNISHIDLDANKRLIGEDIDEKIGRLDVRAKAETGEDYNIEIQVQEYEHMENRMLYYWGKVNNSKLKRGEDYKNITPTISILIADFNLQKLKEIPKYHTKWNLREEKYSDKILTDRIELHVLELPKMKKQKKIKDELSVWLEFLTNPDCMEVSQMAEKDPILERAMKELEYLRGDPDFQEILDRRMDAIRDEISFRNYAQRKGLEEGRKKGLKEGRKETREEITKKLLKLGLKIEDIEKATNLSREEIEKLK